MNTEESNTPEVPTPEAIREAILAKIKEKNPRFEQERLTVTVMNKSEREAYSCEARSFRDMTTSGWGLLASVEDSISCGLYDEDDMNEFIRFFTEP